jgi:hypothetical protein
MAHAQKPDFVFRRNGRVHLNRRARQFSRLLAADVCTSAVVMLDTPCSEVVWRVLATHSIRQFSLHFSSRGPSHFNWTLIPLHSSLYMKPASSIPCSNVPAVNPVMNQIHPILFRQFFFKDSFYTALHSTPISVKWRQKFTKNIQYLQKIFPFIQQNMYSSRALLRFSVLKCSHHQACLVRHNKEVNYVL